MKEKTFVEKNIDMPLISSRDFPLISDNPGMLRVQVHKWVEKGTLIQLKRGLYLLNVPGIKKPPDFYIANKIVFPSYVSMESALSYHELIPEAVYSTVSVTTKKTNNFNLSSSCYFCNFLILNSIHNVSSILKIFHTPNNNSRPLPNTTSNTTKSRRNPFCRTHCPTKQHKRNLSKLL